MRWIMTATVQTVIQAMIMTTMCHNHRSKAMKNKSMLVVRQLIALSLLQLMSPGQIASQIEVEIDVEVGGRGSGKGLAQITSPVVEIGPTDSSLYEKNCVET